MGDPSDPGQDPIAQNLFTQKCLKCGAYERCSTCQAQDCGQRFVLQPAGSRILCPPHDPTIDDAVAASHLVKALLCPGCGERLFDDQG